MIEQSFIDFNRLPAVLLLYILQLFLCRIIMDFLDCFMAEKLLVSSFATENTKILSSSFLSKCTHK